MKYPSIFNDIIGPVMRGPSSSHCAAAVRIGKIARDLMDGDIGEVRIEFDTGGALATTHTDQGTDMGLFAGLLGWEPTDARLMSSEKAVFDAGISVSFHISDFGFVHPGTCRLILKNTREEHALTAVSLGGGMIAIINIDNIAVAIEGDYHEVLVYCEAHGDEVLDALRPQVKDIERSNVLLGKGFQIVELQSRHAIPVNSFNEVLTQFPIRSIKKISPVLPVLSRKNISVPFLTANEMLEYNKKQQLELWELAVQYESQRSGLSKTAVFEKMGDIVTILEKSIKKGIAGTTYKDRILGPQSPAFAEQMNNNGLLDGALVNRIILYVTAMMEIKSSFGVIVAAPTAGSCGALPGACLGAAAAMGLSTDEMTKAMLAAGMIGVFISYHSTFAAEVGGCQAECGAGSGMAAAALVTLAKGTIQQALAAASIALQNVLGMVCDPVANRVEVPCLGKNVMAATNAFSCANMALAGFDEVVPLDETIDAMDTVGKSIPAELRCTALGGLSVTKTSRALANKLNKKRNRVRNTTKPIAGHLEMGLHK